MRLSKEDFRCRNCGGTKAKDTGDGMLHCTTCGMQTPAESAARRSSQTPPVTPVMPRRNTGLGWRTLVYLPLLFSLGLASYYVVQAYRSGDLGRQIPNIFHPNGKNYTWTGNDHGVYVGKGGKPEMFIIGTRRLNTGRGIAPGNGPYLIFYSLPDYNELNSKKLDFPKLKSVGNRFEIRPAGYGVFYALLNKERLLRINSFDFTFEDVTESLLTHPALAGSVKKITALSGVHSACFEVETAAKKKAYYNPSTNKIYASLKDAFGETGTAVMTDSEIGFAFSQRSALFPDSPMQLIRYVVLKSGNSFTSVPRFSLQRAPGNSTFGRDAKTILNATGAVHSFERLNPGRPYYKARVLYWDTDLVLIISAKLPERDALQILESLDPRTGEVHFTLPLPSVDYPTDVVRYAEGFLLKDAASVLLVSNRGALVKELKIQ